MDDAIPPHILARYRDLAGRPHRRFGAGLINRTFVVEGPLGPAAVVQRLHPVFSGIVNEDIDAITAHLARKGLATPRPIRTDDGALWVDGVGDDEGRPWRALTFVEGECFERVPSAAVAREAGRLVARFHGALGDLEHDYRHVRAGVHDTPRHLAALRAAVGEHRGHRLHGEVSALAGPLLAAAARMPDLSAMPLRHAHGDLKISNLVFRGGVGHCLVDLDTLGRLGWPFELGDALRSWCNPAGEDADCAAIEPDLFAAAVEGYGEGARGSVSAAEARALVAGLATICVELSARFLADALAERYFAFDASRYATRGDHNLVRGAGQYRLFESVDHGRAALERLVERALVAG
jgi:Ser/Thr protein kinase RdoA (MazF antagonist)